MSVPRRCFEKLNEKYKKLELEHTTTLLSMEEAAKYFEKYEILKDQLDTHKQFLNLLEEKDKKIKALKREKSFSELGGIV